MQLTELQPSLVVSHVTVTQHSRRLPFFFCSAEGGVDARTDTHTLKGLAHISCALPDRPPPPFKCQISSWWCHVFTMFPLSRNTRGWNGQVFKLIPFIDQGSEDFREQIYTLIDELIIQRRVFGFYDSVLFCTKVQFWSACSLCILICANVQH